MQFVLIVNVVLLHQFWIIPKHLQRGKLRVPVLLHVQSGKQFCVVLRVNIIIPKTPPLIPKHKPTAIQSVLIGTRLQSQPFFTCKAQIFHNVSVHNDKIIVFRQCSAPCADYMPDKFTPITLDTNTVQGYIILVYDSLHCFSQGNRNSLICQNSFVHRFPVFLFCHADSFQVDIGRGRLTKSQRKVLR